MLDRQAKHRNVPNVPLIAKFWMDSSDTRTLDRPKRGRGRPRKGGDSGDEVRRRHLELRQDPVTSASRFIMVY